jgi:hypothetical protein
MRSRIFSLSLVMFSGVLYQAFGVSGFAVSAVNSVCGTNGKPGRTIVKYIVQDDKVTRCDTIFKAFQASYPHLNIQGTRCAFIRRGITQTDTARSANDIYSYLSVMDLSSGAVRDLDTFFTWEFHSTQGSKLSYLIEWPAGDYIYYTKHVKWWYDGDGVPTAEVWKVKYNDPSSRSLVVKYWSAQTFSMSHDTKRAGVTDLSNNEFHCLPHAFPPAVNPTKAGLDSKVWVGCGTYISPSGKYHWHFFEGGHSNWRINTWNPPNELLATVDVSADELASWAIDKSLTKENIGGGPLWWARWAVNSDRWIVETTQLYNMRVSPPFPQVGNNQVLVDWVGHKLIVTSQNWQADVTDCTIRVNEPGDMWVAGGPAAGNAYEGIDGNWYDAMTHAKVQDGSVGVDAMPPGRLSVKREYAGNGAATLYSLRGERIGGCPAQALGRHTSVKLRNGAFVAVGSGNTSSSMVVPIGTR